METEHNTRLTSAEISQLWTAYVNDTMAVCFLNYFLNKCEDTEIRDVVQYGLEISQSHIKKLTEIFQRENYPIPYGFTLEEDVDTTAPRLYSDSYVLVYMKQMGYLGMNSYSMATPLSARLDVYEYFSECLAETNKLHRIAKDVLLSKGLYIRSPYISKPKQVDFVKKQSFLTGWFGERRPLTALEIAHLYSNIQRNGLGIATLTGFAQTAKSKEVGRFMEKGAKIASKHIEIFGSIMREDRLPVPMTWDTDVTDSTVSVFSDKMMMFVTTALIAIGIGYYGTSIATSARRDLQAQYTRLNAEILQFSEDGANIMIENGWLEEPPRADDRQELANT
jgi:hypothetical protein